MGDVPFQEIIGYAETPGPIGIPYLDMNNQIRAVVTGAKFRNIKAPIYLRPLSQQQASGEATVALLGNYFKGTGCADVLHNPDSVIMGGVVNLPADEAWQLVKLGAASYFAATDATPIPGSPYQITPTVPAGMVYDGDLGVINAATEAMFANTGFFPTAGQYSFSGGGVYTFVEADHAAGISVIISYLYTFED